ncbi:MAG: filamentous hemagglutinin N-terminal domain-containing protein [Nitrospira sp.]|nr:filamentous hemagglutinin N-terminal domain-containing protein [Nitrospira sp.]
METYFQGCCSIVIGSLWLLFSFQSVDTHAAPPITPSGLNTQVNLSQTPPIGKVQYDITGGTRAGTNLFHSLGDFNVPTNNIANFLNDSGLATSNILSRVTGGNPSNIFGTIQTTGFGNANLFLMNPAGVIFGPNATLNVGGMATFTTADYLRLAEVNAGAGMFYANPSANSILTTAPVAAFGFLGTNPAAITVQGSQLSVQPNQSISLVGGDTTIQGGTLHNGAVQSAKLSAPGGHINLVSVASPGEVLYSTFQTGPNVNGQSFSSMGNVTLSGGSLLDVSANAAGMVQIRGGQLVIDDATILANTIDGNAAPVAVNIKMTGDVTISDTRAVTAISATTSGTGNAGEVQITSANMRATSTDPDLTLFALIDTHSTGDGRAGNVNITTGNLTVTSPSTGPTWYFIDTGPQGAGLGGDVTITASNHIELTNTYLSTGTQNAELLGLEPSTSAGKLTITANSLQTKNVILDTHATTAFDETQLGGDITLNVHDINMVNTQVAASALGRGGAITIDADSLIATDNSQFQTFNAFGGPGSGIDFTGRILEMRNGSNWNTSTFGDFKAGDIVVNATDHVSLAGIANEFGHFNPSGLFSNSVGGAGTQGVAGNITVTTPKLTMEQGRINTSTATSGSGGTVTINAGTMEISGEFPFPDFGGFFGITNIHPSGIFTQTVGSEFCSGACGNAGNINITTGFLIMGNGSQINSGTTNSGHGGNIMIQTTNQIAMSGTLSNGDSVGVFSRTVGTTPDSGSGGNISLTAGRSVTMSNGATISSSSTGPGNTGNIDISAGNQFTMANSSVTTEANQSGGGIIKITTEPSGTVQLSNSRISASVLDGTGGGGSVNIDPQFVILQNSQILAQAVQGPGGNINITITNDGLFLPDATSVVSASSQFGQSGSVIIQSPNAPAGGKIQPLNSTPLQVTALLSQRCAAIARGEVSSFVVAGRDTLPTEPGGWLTSPLASIPAEGGISVEAGVPAIATHSDGSLFVSLRRLPSPSQVAQILSEEDWIAGCESS